MAGGMENHSRKRQVLSFFLCLCVSLGACETIRYSVPEEKKSGSLVANIAKDLKLDVGKLSGRSARLVSKSSKQYFELNTSSGDVIIKEKIDREDLCGQRDPCLLQFEIVLENPLQLYRIEVQIEDVNDNSPNFSKNEFVLKMPEQIPINTRFPLEGAQDSDIGTNGIQSYVINPNEHFRLLVQTLDTDGSKYAELVLEKQLDREEQAQLMLILTAADGGLPQRTGTAQIRVNVLDNNDNFPQFSQSVYKVQLMENSPKGTLVTKVEASDLDQGSNAEITYSFRQVPDRVLKLFKLNQLSGEITVWGIIDYEERSNYEMNIQATDGGGFSAHCKVLIQIKDMNDNAPEVTLTSLTSTIPEDSSPETVVALFSVSDRDSGDNGRTLCSIQDNFSQSVYKVQLMENSPRDTLVTKVEASDLDQGSNAEITYSFRQVPDRVLKLFKLNQLSGEITVWGIIDYEERSNYEMNIQATDGGGFSAHCKVLIQIKDMNDNAPEVTLTSLTSTIPEDSSPETVVALFSVSDRDSGDNGRTLCSIQDNVPFALKSTVKNYYELVTQKPLDREKVPEYNITITATDRGTPRLTSVRVIRVQLSDINDNPPVFNESSYVMYLKENNPPGLLIGTVRAADLDTEQNAKVTYSALPGNIGDLPFSSSISINSENGKVYALQSLDYEQRRDFQVTVRAADGGPPPLSSEVIVRVVIIDENDNAPFILYPLQNSSSPANDLVPRSAEAGSLVTKVVAVDGDSGQNSWLSYQLLKATDPSLFTVGLQTGEVKTSRPITSPDSVKQKLIVLVRDNGEPPRSTTSTLNVLLVDGFSDAYMQLLDVPQEEEQQDTLTLYLVISLSFISFLFLVSVVTIISVRLYKTRQCRDQYVPSSRNFYSDRNFPTNPAETSGTGTLPQSYCYEVCLTTGSGASEFKFLRPLVPSLPVDPSVAGGSVFDSQINSLLNEEKESEREVSAYFTPFAAIPCLNIFVSTAMKITFIISING
uniref:Cadherin domain-containing protein n=1 Tax=Chelonoidis abingdonii TaxID=106734 RepID=A0A8C0HAF8_CHEAB